MSTVHTWTLWQRLPPRYQLTSRVVEDDELIDIVTDRSQSLQLHSNSNSRPTSGVGFISPRQPPQPVVQEKDDFMLGSNVPEPVQVHMSNSIQKIPQGRSFPNRKSDYINHFQTQKRVNSARRRLAETPPSPTVPVSPTEQDTSRSNTAPVFPVTSPATYSERKPRLGEPSITVKKQTTPNFANQKPKAQREATKVNVFQFDDSKSFSNPQASAFKQDQDSKAKKYVIQDTKRATMYIDNGKVIYFGKSRHDLTALLKTQSLRGDRGNCFLADLRRDYLKHPKYEGRLGRRNEADPKRIASERVDYNRKVEHILNYYSEDTEGAMSRPSSAYRAVTPKGSRRKGLALASNAPSRPPSRAESPLPDRPESPGAFIRFNKQSKLHDRQFYLRTPGIKHEKTLSELEKCRCSVCRIELQLALVTGMNNTLGLTSSAQKNSDTKQTNQTNAVNDNSQSVSVGEKVSPMESNIKDKSTNGQRVSFKQPEQSSPRVQENTLMISCTLPEMEDMAVSESGLESARTRDVESTVPDDETIGETSVA